MDRFLLKLALVICIILLVACGIWWFGSNHSVSHLFNVILYCGAAAFCLGGMTMFDVIGTDKARGSAQLGGFGGYVAAGGDVGAKTDQHRRRAEMNFPFGFFLFSAGLIILVGSAIRFLFV
jgi:hypothetical protein